MRVFLTGATGFIGSAVAALLRSRGDDVVALVRTPGRAAALAQQGCELVEGDLADQAVLGRAMSGADAVIHAAAVYEVGIPPSRRAELVDVNVAGTERVLNAARGAGVPRVVYISTVNALGNTEGKVADESTRHHGRYVSVYDETKHAAHQIAERKIAEGLPGIIVLPSAVYGPGDHSAIGATIGMFMAGRLPALALADGGFSLVHRDDVAAGIVTVLDRGRVGEQYILSGDNRTLRDLVETLAEVSGRRAPRFTVPTPVLKTMAPLGRVIGPAMGVGPNLRELVSAGEATYYATHDKATAELGYAPRSLKEGLRATLEAEGRL